MSIYFSARGRSTTLLLAMAGLLAFAALLAVGLLSPVSAETVVGTPIPVGNSPEGLRAKRGRRGHRYDWAESAGHRGQPEDEPYLRELPGEQHR